MKTRLEDIKPHFEKRTKRHIELTQKFCKKIDRAFSKQFEGIVERGEQHDQSKYGKEELDPYIWLTWEYKCKDDGVECKMPQGMKEKIHAATEHHIRSNAHHPEFHVPKGQFAGINKKDRDKPPGKLIDATAMTDLDIAEMVADWCAMSEERGSTPRSWANQNVNVRWKFTPKQEKLIYKLIKAVW